jgi:hypothetical protein
LLAELKGRISAARLKAALAVNSELILLCWQIGHSSSSVKPCKRGESIIERQPKNGGSLIQVARFKLP